MLCFINDTKTAIAKNTVDPVPPPPAPVPTTPAPVPVPDTSSVPLPEEPIADTEVANNNALYIGLGIAFTLLALFGLSRLRPEYSTTVPEYRPATSMPAAESEIQVSPQQVAVNRSRITGRLVGSGTNSSIEMDDAFLSSKEGLVIGRSANLNHVVLNDSRVSRRHCRLRKEGHIVVLEDLNSTHGTSVTALSFSHFQKLW